LRIASFSYISENQITRTPSNYAGVCLQNTYDYSPFGVSLDGRTIEGDFYRRGFNGMEKDDEVKGKGNNYDFGARIFDPRVGRWLSVDKKEAKKSFITSFNFCSNNPILFIDPDGNTDFYFGSKWIGTDGNNNGLIAKVTDYKLSKDIIKNTKQGLYFNSQSTDKGATSTGGMLLIQREVLKEASILLKKSLTKEGEVGEFAISMSKSKENDCFEVIDSKYEAQDGVDGLKKGDVSIHSHPTGIDKEGRISMANQPSTVKEFGENSDEFNFRKSETNIIVGNNGEISPKFITQSDGSRKQVGIIDNRYSAINIFDNKAQKIGEIGLNESDMMLKGNRGRIGKRFEKHQDKIE
jgi:RHS repeat-associated protein